ncbi:MAG: hypothetical protein ACRC6N_07950, partial [Plesiomonas sp.]|uniref:hypothetical protein n=1 Tax=Plesiomonas sp. TaxID=2486279 RepID=UPI003F2D429D
TLGKQLLEFSKDSEPTKANKVYTFSITNEATMMVDVSTLSVLELRRPTPVLTSILQTSKSIRVIVLTGTVEMSRPLAAVFCIGF